MKRTIEPEGELHQMSLGELIDVFEKINEAQKARIAEGREEAQVRFDFGSAMPTDFGSWRGAYEELALGYRLTGYDNAQGHHFGDMTVSKFLAELKAANGAVFTGWKGGEFKMYRDTPVWVANSGNSDHTVIVKVVDDGWSVLLMTRYCEY